MTRGSRRGSRLLHRLAGAAVLRVDSAARRPPLSRSAVQHFSEPACSCGLEASPEGPQHNQQVAGHRGTVTPGDPRAAGEAGKDVRCPLEGGLSPVGYRRAGPGPVHGPPLEPTAVPSHGPGLPFTPVSRESLWVESCPPKASSQSHLLVPMHVTLLPGMT